MKAPAFQLYADDFLAGVIDMEDDEVGIYIRLLCLSWSKGHLDSRAIRAASFDRNDDAVGEVLRMKFVEDDAGRWYNERLESIRNEREAYRNAMSERGKKGADARWHKHPVSNAQAMPNPMPGNGSPSPSPSPSPSSSSSPIPNKAAAAALNGFSFENVDLEALKITASAITRARPRSLDREFVWRACMLCEAVIPGLSDDIRRRLLEGKIDNPTSYVESIIRQETKLTTREIRETMAGIPVPRPAAP